MTNLPPIELLLEFVGSSDANARKTAIETLKAYCERDTSALRQAGEALAAAAAEEFISQSELHRIEGLIVAIGALAASSPTVRSALVSAAGMGLSGGDAVKSRAIGNLKAVSGAPEVSSFLAELAADGEVDDALRNMAFDALYGDVAERLKEQPTASLNLRVLESDGDREQALEFIDELRSAILKLEDLGVDDEQREIINAEILPLLSSLEHLLGEARAESSGELEVNRREAVWGLGRVTGLGQALAISATGLANADEAVATVRAGVAQLGPVGEMIWNLLSK